jgi:predicted pyridoxine 5'-phosphate oxidase superfamily flavin-nucleotide-binding protein
MGILTEEMQRVVTEQRLGYVATVSPDGTPNLSPKGTLAVWDADTLIFADIRSPRTIANLSTNPAVEVNVVDPFLRKGYRFKGTATVVTDGSALQEGLAFYERRGVTNPIRAVVLIHVERALPLISPAYDQGLSEDEVRTNWRRYWASLGRGDEVAATGE